MDDQKLADPLDESQYIYSLTLLLPIVLLFYLMVWEPSAARNVDIQRVLLSAGNKI